MNCANHPDTPAASYCQFCGKPLCAQCAHKINNVVGCEPCLAARLGVASGTYGVNINDSKGFQYTATGPLPPGVPSQPGVGGTQPWVAFWLGWIPGVGAMYNGQFAKALVHVLIFAALASLADQHDFFGFLVVSWLFYQVFDAYQTAIARRDGLPLPNPLGLNDVGHWLGIKNSTPYAGVNPFPPNPPPPVPDPAAGPAGSSSGFGSSVPGAAPFTQSFTPGQPFTPPYASPPMPPVPPDQVDTPDLFRSARGIPTGAVVLVILGVVFLLGNLGIFSSYWVGHSWPLILIAVGVWLVIQRSQNLPPGGVR